MMHNNLSLLVRPPLLPEETLSSYLYRLSAANILTPWQLIALVRLKANKSWSLSRIMFADTFNVLAELTGLEIYKLYWATEHSFTSLLLDPNEPTDTLTFDSGFTFPLLPQKVFSRNLRIKGRAQFCPYCLEEGAYQRRAWRVKNIAACIHHQCLLVEICPNCNMSIRDLDVIKTTCQCGFHLAEAPTVDLSSDPDGLDTQRLLLYWLNAGPQIRLPLPQESNHHLYLLAFQMMERILFVKHEMDGLHPFPKLSNPYNWAKKVPSCLHTYVLWATVVRGLFNWPESFHQLIEYRLYADHMRYSSRFLIRMGWWIRDWLKLWPEEMNLTIHRGLTDYLHRNCCWGYTQKSDHDRSSYFHAITVTFPEFTGNFEWVRQSIALRLLEVRLELVRQLVKVGLIREKSETAQFKDPLISREDVLKFYQRWENGIPLCDVEPALNISTELVGHLVEAGILKTVDGDTSECVLEKSSVNGLIWRFFCVTDYRHMAKSAFYNLKEACHVLAPFDFDEFELFQLAIKGMIPIVLWKGDTLGYVMFQRKAVWVLAKYLAKKESFISVDDFCKQFLINERGLRALIQSGQITWPAMSTYILKREADTLREKYYSFREAERLLQVGKKTVDGWIAAGILPVAVESRYYRSRLFLKQDVEKVLGENSSSQDEIFELIEDDQDCVQQ